MVSQQLSAPELPSADSRNATNVKPRANERITNAWKSDMEIFRSDHATRFTAMLRVRPHGKQHGDAAQLNYRRRDETDHQSDLRRAQCHSNNATEP